MNIFIVILSIILFLAVAAVLYLLRKNQKPQENQGLLMLQNQLNEVSRTLETRLGESTRLMQNQFGESTRIVRDVTDRLAKLDETNRQVIGFADQLQRLQDILKNPKHRGGLGEYYLETLLKNAFQPKQYQMQYEFKNGDKVDAVLFVGDKIVPVDSKFSLENYNRLIEENDPIRRAEYEALFKQDLKKRIDETAKYIRPQEGTTDFAFMFIPAEGIYYDLLVNKVGAAKINTRDLFDYAVSEKRVHIVAPTTFYVVLQSMGQGMKAYQIQESTKEILKNVGMLEKHLRAYSDYYIKLGKHLQTTVNTYDNASKEFMKIDKDIFRLTGEQIDAELPQLDRPREYFE